MSRDRIAMTDPPGVEQYSIEKIAVTLIADFKSFATVEKEWDIQILCFTLLAEVKKLRNEVTKLVSHFFVANEVETYSTISLLAFRTRQRILTTDEIHIFLFQIYALFQCHLYLLILE